MKRTQSCGSDLGVPYEWYWVWSESTVAAPPSKSSISYTDQNYLASSHQMASRSLPPYQRRRSHSAHDQTSPIRDTSGRISSQITKKRAHASACNASPSSYSLESPTKWDVDRWRKGKRARRDSVDHHHHHHTVSGLGLNRD